MLTSFVCSVSPWPELEAILITTLAHLKGMSQLSHYDIAGYLVPPVSADKVSIITQRALRQHELLKENRRLVDAITRAKKDWEATVDAIEDPLYIVDLNNKIIRANLAVFRLLKKGVAEVVGKKCYSVIHQSDAPPADCIMSHVKDEAAPVSLEVECKGLSGNYVCSAYPQIFEGGFGVVHVLRDFKPTGPVDRYRFFFEKSPVAILCLEFDSRKIIDANSEARDLLGLKKDEFVDLQFDSLLPDKKRDSVIKSIPRQLDGLNHEIKSLIFDRDKDKIPVTMRFSMVDVAGKRLLQVVLIP